MTLIPDDVLEQVRRAVGVADLVGRYLPLRRSGRGFTGLCPFHQEKTPSFHVTPERGIWKCFGCGKGGNVFTFLMEREGIAFPEAVRQLAREAGVVLPDDDDPAAAARAARAARLRDVTEWACRFFEASLRAPDGERARAYFKRRGIAGATARDFRLGYAPPAWEALLAAAGRDGIPEADLAEAGLVRRREDRPGCYDWFRDRVMFPICDTQGRVIAFGGRVLDDSEPKYLNSPETPIFSKGHHLYALDRAKQEMLRTGEAAVMEGYTDVLLAHQAGFRVAVAGLGTALTPEQARKLAPYVKKLFLVYDGDAAGLRAALRAVPAFLPEALETRVVVLPDEKDPAEVIVEDGVDAFRAALASGREAFDHLLSAYAAANDMTSVPGRSAAIDAALGALVGVGDEVRRALYLRRLADEYGVPEDVARNRLREMRRRSGGGDEGTAAPPSPRTPRAAEGGPAARVSDSAEPPPAADAAPPSRTERLLLEALVGAPELLAEAPEALEEALPHAPTRALVATLRRAAGRGGDAAVDVARVLGALAEPSLAAYAAEVAGAADGKTDLLRQGRDCMERLLTESRDRRLRERLASAGDADAEAESLRHLQTLHRRRAGGDGAPNRAADAG